MKHILAASLASLLLTSTQSAQTLRHARIDVQGAPALAAVLEQEGFGILEGSIQAGSFELIDSAQNLSELQNRGYATTLLAIGRPLQEIQAELPPPAGYQDLAALNNRMAQVAANFPAIAQFVDITDTYNAPATFEGRHIFGLKISDNVGTDEDEPAVLIVSDHHAREVTTPVLAFEIIDQLTQGYGVDPSITASVNGNEIWVIPTANPDGYNWVFVGDNFWRKNRRVFSQGIGVDLNRNYAYRWNGACGGSTNVNNETYRGPSVNSEAEVQTIVAMSTEERFAKVLDYHSFGREVLIGYASCSVHPQQQYLRQTGITLAQMSGYGTSNRLPSADGEHQEWQIRRWGALGYLIEISTSFQPSFASAISEAQLVTPGALWFLELPIPISGHVTDAITGDPVEADILLQSYPPANNEMNQSDPQTGRYHAFVPNGEQNRLTFSAPGYITREEAYFVRAGQGLEVDIELVPVGQCPTATVRKRIQSTNPDVYTATPAILGQNVNLTSGSNGFNFVTFFGVSQPAARPSDRGFIHIEVDAPAIFRIGPVNGPVANATFPVPNDPAMCGMIIYSQAKLHNATGNFQVSNSQDLTMGL